MKTNKLKIASLIKYLKSIELWKLQQIVYILQKEGLDFGMSFRYAAYDPYSDDLQFELDYLVEKGILIERHDQGVYTYIFNTNTGDTRTDEVSDTKIRDKSELVDYLSSLSVIDIETVGSIYFLKGKLDPTYKDDENVKKKIRILKPDLNGTVESAYEIYHEIKRTHISVC